MSRAIFVLSLPRSGSSCVAGAMHRLGVNMGEGFWQPIDANNQRGYYEDLRWQRLNKSLAGNRYGARQVFALPERHRKAYRDLFEKCCLAPLWGVKAPRMAFLFQHLHSLCPCEMRVVIVHRNIEDVIASIQRHSEVAYGGELKMSEFKAGKLIGAWNSALDKSAMSFDGPKHAVSYEALVKEPEAEVCRLAEFCFAGMPMPDLTEAIEWVDPTLWHQRSSFQRLTMSAGC